jgi:TRAP-type C4-dicarboxylate transport system permease small subunit
LSRAAVFPYDRRVADTDKPGGAGDADEAPKRPSLTSIAALEAPTSYPDDGAAAKLLRRIDAKVAFVERAVLFALLAVIIVTAAFEALADVIANKTYPETYEIVRDGVFALALIAPALAAQQERLLAMDLVSRRLPPRGQLILRIALCLFTIFVTALLLRAGLRAVDIVSGEATHLIPRWMVIGAIPFGAGLIIFHIAVQMVIAIEYLARGKIPPARARAH